MCPNAFAGQRVRIISGQYAGRSAKVLHVLLDHGEHGFAEVEIVEPGRKKPLVDLVPLPYLDRAGDRYANHA